MTSVPEPLAAALADRYRLERELGAGGMATVYLAQDLKHDRKVAIKVLRPELAAVLGAERFLSEIKTTANLQHPHILPLFDSGAADGFLFYVMPFVEGETVRGRLTREQQLPIADAVRIAADVAGALDYAHRRGIIHRDIKPENILLHDGSALVADFGIALAVDAAGGERLTETGLAIGTAQYMSPEQAMGERVLDGRSDIYSLGVVLYELLAGEPPYTGPTAQAIAAKRLTLPVPSVRLLRETVPEPLDRAVATALAKARADRYETARQFAEAIVRHGQPTTAAVPPAPPARRRLLPRWAALAVLMMAAGAALVRWWPGTGAALDPNLLAVTPFDAVDPSLAVWREGVVDMLSRTLDGAGSLRTVSASSVLRGWQGRSDGASATALARRTGAGLASTGSVSRRGHDSVELRASLLDIERSTVISDITVAGPAAELGELVDSLGLEILRALSRDRPVAAVRQANIGAAPLPALKAFLRGEQFYRRTMFDSALDAYSDAIANDSTLAMAYYHMGLVLGWKPPSASAYQDIDYSTAANRWNHGLGVRDSLLIAADAALHASDNSTDSRTWYLRRGSDLLREAAQRFPGDPEVWYTLGEYLTHVQMGFGSTNLQALDAFDRSIALDSAFGPAYEHTIPLALQTGQPERALRYARAASTIKATDEKSSTVHFEGQLLLSMERGDSAITPLLDGASATFLYDAGIDVFWTLPDSSETTVRIFRQLAHRHLRAQDSYDFIVDSLMRVQYVAAALAFRGHLREAYQIVRTLNPEASAPWYTSWLNPFVTLTLLGTVPHDAAAGVFNASLVHAIPIHADLDAHLREFNGAPWWAMQHDTTALRLFGRQMRQTAASNANPQVRLKARYLQMASTAYLTLVLGDSVAALGQFAALPDSVCPLVACHLPKLQQARLLAASGRDTNAAELLDAFIATTHSAIGIIARVERARIAERLHDRQTAIRLYQFVVDVWRHADPELQPYVTEARGGLARLTAEGS